MLKQISDIVRDNILKARKGRSDNSLGNNVVLTDHEACDLWSSLTEIEAEVSKLKSVEFKALKDRFARIEKYLKVSKVKVKNARAKQNRSKS